jgi:hypothetical protein
MTKEQKEQLARQRFIEEVQQVGGRLTIYDAVEIIRKLDLNSRRDKALYDSDARLAREWLAEETNEQGDRLYHNIKTVGADGKPVQEFVQEKLFNIEDYRLKVEDETKALKHNYKKLAAFVSNCYERFGVKLRVDLSFIKPVGRTVRARKAARRVAASKQRSLTDEL